MLRKTALGHCCTEKDICCWIKEPQFQCIVYHERIHPQINLPSLSLCSAPQSKYQFIKLIILSQASKIISWALLRQKTAALTAGYKRTGRKGHGIAFQTWAWGENLHFRICSESWSVKQRVRKREHRQKYRQINRHRQMDRKTEEEMRRRIFESERESWTLFSYCFHPCLCSVMTQHWPSNDTVEEKRNPNLCVHNCTALPHHSLPTQLKNSIHTIEVEKYKK